jgi:hypothetical protein
LGDLLDAVLRIEDAFLLCEEGGHFLDGGSGYSLVEREARLGGGTVDVQTHVVSIVL